VCRVTLLLHHHCGTAWTAESTVGERSQGVVSGVVRVSIDFVDGSRERISIVCKIDSSVW
jgi:hypothetical protein